MTPGNFSLDTFFVHGISHAAGHTLVTFEKAAKKLPATLVLPTS